MLICEKLSKWLDDMVYRVRRTKDVHSVRGQKMVEFLEAEAAQAREFEALDNKYATGIVRQKAVYHALVWIADLGREFARSPVEEREWAQLGGMLECVLFAFEKVDAKTGDVVPEEGAPTDGEEDEPDGP